MGLLLGLLAAVLTFALAPRAEAAEVRPFIDEFGSVAQPSFAGAQALAVDEDSGDLLVFDATALTLSRFKANGEPSPFPALGGNVIDAKKGPEDKPCIEEPASCDATPENGFVAGAAENRPAIAVDNSGNPLTDGNIYVTQGSASLVDVFDADGSYLGQIKQFQERTKEVQRFNKPAVQFTLTVPGFGPPETTDLMASNVAGSAACTSFLYKVIGEALGNANCLGQGLGAAAQKTITFEKALVGRNIPPMEVKDSNGNLLQVAETLTEGGVVVGSTTILSVCGIAVDSSGNVYLGSANVLGGGAVIKYSPTASVPSAADNVATFAGVPAACNVAVGTSDTVGSFFVKSGSEVSKRDIATGKKLFTVAPGSNTTVAVNPSDGRIFVASGSTATEYDASGASSAIAKATTKSPNLSPTAVEGVAVDGSTNRVYVSRAGVAQVEVYGDPIFSPTVQLFAAAGIEATQATLRGSVDPEDRPMVECKFEYGLTASYGSTIPCAEVIPTGTDSVPVSAKLVGLAPEQTYHYRLVAANDVGVSETADGTFSTSALVFTDPATQVNDGGATLNGRVTPAGSQFSTCKFQYLTESDYFANGNSFSGAKVPQVKECNPGAGAIEPDFSQHAVSATVTGLAKNASYRFRLVATKGATTYSGAVVSFSTQGSPTISETVPLLVDGDWATLQAKVNPNGSGTTYRFEWGPTTAYGNSAPVDVEPFLGGGSTPATATAKVTGLQAASTYHFRIVASNASGTTTGPDRTFETLNQCGFTENRCLELVSPADKGPVAEVGELVFENPLAPRLRPSADGESVAYSLTFGLPDATVAAESQYQAGRSGGGWSSQQISPPILGPWNLVENISYARYISDDLRCVFFSTSQVLAPDTPLATTEEGEHNLFLRQPDGTFRVLTSRAATSYPPRPGGVGPVGSMIDVIGASPDCERVVFSARLDYLGIGSGLERRLYEWEDGELRNAGIVPGGPAKGMAVAPGAGMSEGTTTGNYWNAVSTDATSVAFTATRQSGGLPAETGKKAVFLRQDDPVTGPDGAETLDVSASETAEPSTGAVYEAASTDGERVFFLSNYGLAGPSSAPGVTSCSAGNDAFGAFSGAGCDLYLYDAGEDEGERLTDLSATTAPGNTAGAAVAGVLGVSDSGSHVYFAARGQLVPNRGRTYQENLAGAGSYNVYLWREGAAQLSYVGPIAAEDFTSNEATGAHVGIWQSGSTTSAFSSRVTPDGTHLLFQSSASIGASPGGVVEAYLYSADADSIECVSCRRDGQASLATPEQQPLATATLHTTGDPQHPPVTLADDGSQVFFSSPNVLALGAVAGEVNLYEWNQGQISLLSTGMAGVRPVEGARKQLTFAGASTDGEDVFFATSKALVPQDFDGRMDLYDARSGGGFAPPPPPPTPCDALGEGSCQGAAAPPAPFVAPASSTIVGAGNEKPATQKKKGKKKNGKGKKKGSKSKKKSKASKANKNRRAGK